MNALRRPTLSATSLILGAIFLLPLVWVISMSIRTSEDVFRVSLVPHTFRPGNFPDAWDRFSLGVLFQNSLVITAGTALVAVVLSVLAAYGFTRYRNRLTEGIFLLMLIGIMLPPAGVIIPFFVAMRNLGLYNSLQAVIIGEAAFLLPLGILILRGYVESIPTQLIDSARVDGAGEWQAFRHVVLPLLRPAIATFALFAVLFTWNGFLLPLVLLRDPAEATLSVGLATANTQFGQTQLELVSAAAVMALIPMLTVFIAARRYYIRGVTAGALKL